MSSAQSTTSCQLIFDPLMTFKEDLGTIYFQKVTENTITLELASRIPPFSLDELYGITDGKDLWFFRINERIPVPDPEASYLISWVEKDLPSPGIYYLASFQTNKKSEFNQTIDTIGDSLTWVRNGRFLRCLMRDQGLPYDFKGSHTDTFGFEHDGEGGDTTQDVLKRINQIPITDAYFLLIGTNDRIPPQETVNNIIQIAKGLHTKNRNAKIYISTLLPRSDDYFERNQTVNKLLLQKRPICPKCQVLDVGGAFYALADWQKLLPDRLHPSYEGYVELAKIITKQLNRANKRPVQTSYHLA
ncbi:SGNH/GDSL hydrolase family protein [Legionella beliardensis]|nr:GDSL-type esterase/lipase family protein [Legionella beliardensis]